MRNFLNKINWYKVVKGIGYYDFAYGTALTSAGINNSNGFQIAVGIVCILFGTYFILTEEK